MKLSSNSYNLIPQYYFLTASKNNLKKAMQSYYLSSYQYSKGPCSCFCNASLTGISCGFLDKSKSLLDVLENVF